MSAGRSSSSRDSSRQGPTGIIPNHRIVINAAEITRHVEPLDLAANTRVRRSAIRIVDRDGRLEDR